MLRYIRLNRNSHYPPERSNLIPEKLILILTVWLALFTILETHASRTCHAREKLIAVTEA